MNSAEFRRWLANQGCTFAPKKGGSGHLIVRRGDRITELPVHGGGKDLKKGTILAIKKHLGLK